MRHSTLYLPNGFTVRVSPIYGGVSFKYDDGSDNPGPIPPGWSVMIYTEKQTNDEESRSGSPVCTFGEESSTSSSPRTTSSRPRSPVARPDAYERRSRFVRPTLDRDYLFISSISLSAHFDSKSSMAPARLIAVMFWATLWWYFHQDEPGSHEHSSNLPLRHDSKGPRPDWRVHIKREGVFSGRGVVEKLGRAGLVLSEDSSVGVGSPLDIPSPASGSDIFMSRQVFWQLDPRIFLFALGPNEEPPYTPIRHSNPVSPKLAGSSTPFPPTPASLYSSSYIPSFSTPPAAPLLISTAGVRHPIRPKPPQQGALLYTHYIPSLGQTISFRIPSLPRKVPDPREGPLGQRRRSSNSSLSSLPSLTLNPDDPDSEADIDVLHRWMNKPRVNDVWGVSGPQSTQERFLQRQLSDRHLFPVLGCWDNLPFGYFEIYWLKEDKLGRLLPKTPDNWDRGLRCLFGEYRDMDTHRIQVLLSSLLHYCWLSDTRTQAVFSNPSIDNAEAINQLRMAGFSKKGETSPPNKHSAIMKIKRENWEAPVL